VSTRRTKVKEKDLTYCYTRCLCGALYAYRGEDKAWDCSDILLGLAPESGAPGATKHNDTMPFIFWKVKVAPLDWALENRKI